MGTKGRGIQRRKDHRQLGIGTKQVRYGSAKVCLVALADRSLQTMLDEGAVQSNRVGFSKTLLLVKVSLRNFGLSI